MGDSLSFIRWVLKLKDWEFKLCLCLSWKDFPICYFDKLFNKFIGSYECLIFYKIIRNLNLQ